MQTKTFYLNEEKTEMIEIEYGFSFKNTTVKYNMKELGNFKNQKELKKGGEFSLDYSRTLSVKLTGGVFPRLELLLNGEVVPGSPTDPEVITKDTGQLGMVIGGISVVAGLIAEFFQVQPLQELGQGWGSMVIGLIIIGLGFGVKKKSLISLGAIIAIIVLDLVFLIYEIGQGNAPSAGGGVMIKVFFIIGLSQGFAAIKKAKEKKKKAAY
ncbi:hypothetical protein [Flammeovirga sp. SJP92]|uniref:hypothetical protein n=1 Tax=Flammeovirga sp. SJP92 TaxID=1775430 RepID=UPI000786EF3A|nr:hypothetical protein [Flammeovirga sp. SJP92]KXX66832.1 hypothetical protein AVL50_30330 [Flammeovirga sp. SJP92]